MEFINSSRAKMATSYQRNRRGGGNTGGRSFDKSRRHLNELKKAVINGNLPTCRAYLFCHWCPLEELTELLSQKLDKKLEVNVVKVIREFLDFELNPVNIANHTVDEDTKDTFLITAIRHDHQGFLFFARFWKGSKIIFRVSVEFSISIKELCLEQKKIEHLEGCSLSFVKSESLCKQLLFFCVLPELVKRVQTLVNKKVFFFVLYIHTALEQNCVKTLTWSKYGKYIEEKTK
jgi:hypothetical protein